MPLTALCPCEGSINGEMLKPTAPRRKMNTYRTMRLAVLVCQLGLILRSRAQTICNTHSTFRPPENSDISVTCGTEYMEMSVLLCPIYQSLYNESLVALNGYFGKAECYGYPDWTADPPILKFNFSIDNNAVASCGNTVEITTEIGTGMFSDFSNVQFVNISGVINSLDPSTGIITYLQQILYMFSCSYPMQYLVNNTKLGVSGVSLAIRDNNGSFISTLGMNLYSDRFFTQLLFVPETGLNLKTRIFVEVKATNLTERFYVILDRCFATTSPYPTNSTYYDLFVGCTRDGQTRVELNGGAQNAQFSFEAFRFVEHKNKTVSTFYLHCWTRLCEVSTCPTLVPDCSANPGRRKRDAESGLGAMDHVATVTSPPITVTKLKAASQNKENNHTPMGAITAAVVLTFLFTSLAACVAIYFIRRKTRQ